MKVAALDLGTNTFLLLIADVEGGEIREVLHDEVRVVRLGQGVHANRVLHPEALERAEICFRDYSTVIKRFGVEKVLACATSAARDVANGNKLVELAARYSIPLEIISGEREAELTFAGALAKKTDESVCIIDVGGGSTEFIFGQDSEITTRFSLDIGSVRLTEHFVTAHPVAATEFSLMEKSVDAEISVAKHAHAKAFAQAANARIIAVAGTPTTLATLEQGLPFESERVDGYRLETSRIREWTRELARMSVADRQKLAGMEPKRADVLVAGALILERAATALGANAVTVSVRGLRYGIARSLNTVGQPPRKGV